MSTDFFAVSKPRVLAHRGYSELFPENTLAAMQAALKFTPYIETDVWLTRDGVLLCSHDGDLSRLFGVERLISDLDYAELREELRRSYKQRQGQDFDEFRFGIPRLEEALRLFPEARFNIELKHRKPQALEELLRILRRADAEARSLLAAEDAEIMSWIRAKDAPIVTSLSVAEGFELLHFLQNPKSQPPQLSRWAKALQIPTKFQGHRLDRPELIEVAHSLGLELHYWTINDESQMKALLTMGADGIVTDNPELAVAVIEDLKRV